MATLADYQTEYQRTGIGPFLHELLAKIVWSTVRQYPPSEYSPNRIWDQMACEDVFGDWIAERLWGRADLQVMLFSAPTVQQLRAALTTSLRQHLTNKRRRSIAANLYKRIHRMMREDASFYPVGPAGPDQRWMLSANGSSAPSLLSTGELARVACELTDDYLEVVRYGPFSQKLSPILRDPKLRELLLHMLSNAKGSLTLGTILDVIRIRFSLPTEEHTQIDDTISGTMPSPAEEAAVKVSAESVVSRLEFEEAGILAAVFRSEGKFGDAATLYGCSIERVREVVHKAFAMICECSESPDEADAILDIVEMLLIQSGG